MNFDEKDLGQIQDSAKIYTSEEEFSLENAKTNMDLEFSDDQLSQVSFTFKIEKDAKEWIKFFRIFALYKFLCSVDLVFRMF